MTDRSPRISLTGLALLAAFALASEAGEIEGKVTSTRLRSFKDVVVYLEGGGLPEPKPPSTPATMDQRDVKFVPRVLVVVKGTTVAFPNNDDTAHNVYSSSEVKRFNLGTYQKGESRSVTFDAPGVVELLCNVHQEMAAFVVVVPTGFYARPADDGRFSIGDVPAGSHRIVALHPELPSAKIDVIVKRRGATMVDIPLP